MQPGLAPSLLNHCGCRIKYSLHIKCRKPSLFAEELNPQRELLLFTCCKEKIGSSLGRSWWSRHDLFNNVFVCYTLSLIIFRTSCFQFMDNILALCWNSGLRSFPESPGFCHPAGLLLQPNAKFHSPVSYAEWQSSLFFTSSFLLILLLPSSSTSCSSFFVLETRSHFSVWLELTG